MALKISDAPKKIKGEIIRRRVARRVATENAALACLAKGVKAARDPKP